jgi:membrane protein YdbS with pleckstrin-like domain
VPTDDERRQVAAELARRRRAVRGIAFSLVIAVFFAAMVLPSWAVALVAVALVAVFVMAVVRYRHLAATVRAKGF